MWGLKSWPRPPTLEVTAVIKIRIRRWALRTLSRAGIIRRRTRGDTEHLLRSPRNAERLRNALAELDAGRGVRVDLEALDHVVEAHPVVAIR